MANQVKERFSKELKAFGKHLKEIRVSKEVTQEQLAHDAGVSFNSINTIEAGKLNPSLATLLAISKALKVPLKTLVDF